VKACHLECSLQSLFIPCIFCYDKLHAVKQSLLRVLHVFMPFFISRNLPGSGTHTYVGIFPGLKIINCKMWDDFYQLGKVRSGLFIYNKSV